MKKILILFHMGSEVRQFGHSGFIDALIEKGWQVLIGSHRSEVEWNSEINLAVTFTLIPRLKSNFVFSQISVGLDLAQKRRRQKAGLSNWAYGQKTPSKNFKQRLRRAFQAFLGILLTNPVLFQWGQWLEARLIRAQGVVGFENFLNEHRPDAIVVNVPRFGQQSFLLSAAEERGIPRFLFYHTNKDVVALSRIDHQFTGIGVWNEWMQEQILVQNSHISLGSVSITGCSHFDCVNRADWLIQEFDFHQKLGIGAGDKLVLYTAAGPGVVPAEERYIEKVFQALQGISQVNTRLVVRLNPMDDSPRIERYLREKYPQMIVLRPDWYYSRTHNLCFQKKTDAVFFNSLLYYSDVCINIPSTLTVECALAGLPVINIGFDLSGPRPVPGSIRSFWDVDYYSNVRQTGAALLAETPECLPVLILRCLDNRRVLSLQQEDLIRQELHHSYSSQAIHQYKRMIENCFTSLKVSQ